MAFHAAAYRFQVATPSSSFSLALADALAARRSKTKNSEQFTAAAVMTTAKLHHFTASFHECLRSYGRVDTCHTPTGRSMEEGVVFQ